MFQCPMHPQIIQDHAGTCPICGMDLVPMESEAPKDTDPEKYIQKEGTPKNAKK